MTGEQLTLIEPTGREAVGLALDHFKRAAHARRLSEVWRSRGFQRISADLADQAIWHEAEANSLAMLAELEAFAGLTS